MDAITGSLARELGLVPPTMEQPQYNMFERAKVEKEFAPLYGDLGLGTTIWSPLASGLLTGKYNDGNPGDTRMSLKGYEWLKEKFTNDEAKQRLETVKALAGVAGDLGTNLPRLALAWCLRNPHVSTVITGASRVEQLQDNLGALEVVPKLTPEVLEKIEGLLGNAP